MKEEKEAAEGLEEALERVGGYYKQRTMTPLFENAAMR